MRRVENVLILVAMGCAGLAVTGGATAGRARKVPFAVSNETTMIKGPLRADGTVDYVVALNERFGKGVMPENNGFVKWLEVVGMGDGVLEPKTKGEFLKMLGAKEMPAGAVVWESYEAYVQRVAGVDSAKAKEELTTAFWEVWKESAHKELAAYLKSNEKLLATASQAIGRSNWWVPRVDDGRTAIAAFIPSLQAYRDVARALCARATLRGGQKDFAGFMEDITTVRRLARHVAGGPTLLEGLIGVAIEAMAIRSTAAVAGNGLLTEAQCREARALLDAFSAVPDMAQIVDVGERWMSLDLVQWIAIGRGDELSFEILAEVPDKRKFNTIDQQAMDWDVVFKRVNGAYDEIVQTMHTKRMADLRLKNQALEDRFKKATTEALQGRKDLRRDANESPAAYSERIARSFMSFMLSTGKAEELYRKNGWTLEMARVVLAAAEVKARTGKWPATLEELVPGVLKELPKDMYSEGGAMTFRYVVKETGVWVYSVGENGRDDGGVREGTAKDDLGVGAN